MTGLRPTADPHVFIEEKRLAYVRYRRTSDGRRWEVHGLCNRRGDCLIGSAIAGEIVLSQSHLADLQQKSGEHRVDSELDVPVTPEFDSCCGLDTFRYVELARL